MIKLWQFGTFVQSWSIISTHSPRTRTYYDNVLCIYSHGGRPVLWLQKPQYIRYSRPGVHYETRVGRVRDTRFANVYNLKKKFSEIFIFSFLRAYCLTVTRSSRVRVCACRENRHRSDYDNAKKKINVGILYILATDRKLVCRPSVVWVCGCEGQRRRRRRVHRSEIIQTSCLVQTRQVLLRAGLLFGRCAQVLGSRYITNCRVHQ